MVGYRRPEILRDSLVRCSVSPIAEDEICNANYTIPMKTEPVASNQETIAPGVKHSQNSKCP